MSLRVASLESSEIRERVGTSIELDLTVRTDPQLREAKVRGNSYTSAHYSFIAQSSYGPVRIITESSDAQNLLPGSQIRVDGKVALTKESRVAATIFTPSLIAIGDPPQWSQALGSIRNGLREISGDGDAGALIPGMVLGDTSKESDELTATMRRVGLTHIVAVSGANFAIVATFISWLAQFVIKRQRARILLVAIVLLAFIALVRPSPSVLRAAAMAAVALFARAHHQRADPIPALGFAIAAVIVIDPWQSREAGFALSVLATAGLLLVAPRIKAPIFIATPIAATAFCLPVIVALSGTVSLVSILVNVLVAPLIAPITVLGFAAALISPLSPSIAYGILAPAKPLAAMIAAIARRASVFPVLTVWKGALGFLLIALVAFAIYTWRRRALVVIVVLGLASIYGGRFPTSHWDVYFCDVGQGDATVINLENHRAIVIDVGPDPILIDTCLKRLSITEIPLLILTHPHADHVGGLSGVQRNRTIGTVWSGNVTSGTQAHIGPYSISVLWPRTLEVDENPNNMSIAALISSRDLRLFASGDIEPDVQEQLRGLVGEVDIYKVAHHGSRYQDSVLLSELSPAISAISVGEGNTYGHPSDETLALLRRSGSLVYRTDEQGDIAIEAEGHRMKVDYDRFWPQIVGVG